MNQYQTSTESQNKFFASIMNTAKNIMEKASYFVIDFHPSSVGFRWGDDQQEVINYDSSDISQFINEYTKNNRTVVFTDNEKFQNFFRDCVQRFCQNVPNQLVGLYSECSSFALKSRQYHNSDATILEGSEDNNNSNIAVILIPVFAALAIVGVLIAYCKSHHQRRNSNRSPGVSIIRNRRELEDLARGNGQSRSGEIGHMLTQEEADQQLSSVGSGARAHPLPAIDNEVISPSSSRSGTVSRTGSSASIEEDSQPHSDLEEVRTDNRSPSPANASQESPGTSVQNVEGAEISNSQGSSCYC
ncbi:hypothetical protein [Candidatus Mesenet endosymbiont of Phosphuga atrata]|uniref:hypothetical protein n=1 Tax=Candidatus Mesenet endosymbiont of Phosphuga atrata TaxID=3066221 RepID=UPI0030CFC43C